MSTTSYLEAARHGHVQSPDHPDGIHGQPDEFRFGERFHDIRASLCGLDVWIEMEMETVIATRA
jgi:hypothetical protein